MKRCPVPALTRATLLWFVAMLVFGTLYVLTITERLPLSEGRAAAFAFGYTLSLCFGLMLSLAMPRLAPQKGVGRARRLFQGVRLLTFGGLLGVLSAHLVWEFPRSRWLPAEPPPEPLVELLPDLPTYPYHGDIFARGESGRLYLYGCRGDCHWRAAETLPAADPEAVWHDRCLPGNELPPGLRFTPPPPRDSLMMVWVKGCSHDVFVTTYYLLTDDGSMWEWDRAETALGNMVFFLMVYPILLLLSGVVALLWGFGHSARARSRAAKRRSGPRTDATVQQ